MSFLPASIAEGGSAGNSTPVLALLVEDNVINQKVATRILDRKFPQRRDGYANWTDDVPLDTPSRQSG